jgi:serine/threonine protein kinase
MSVRMGGVTEVAELLNVSRQRLSKLRERADFPDPIGVLAQGPIWDLDAVEAWNGSGSRSSTPGRPRTDTALRTLGGRFTLEQQIGRGGFADVYRAADRKQGGRLVAVKILHDTAAVHPEAMARFRRELRLLEGLEHLNVISVLGQGETTEEGTWYAMPLAQGSFDDALGEFEDHPAMILDVMRQVCAGLAYIHAQGIYHRDLKPGNVLRSQAANWAISDFGLAVEVERNGTVLTSTLRAGLGSWWYTAPEQWTNARSADHRSDIYSLGKMLQQMVTGEPPVNNEMPAGPLRPIVERATANKPEQRYGTVEEFLMAVEVAIGAPTGNWETAEDVAKRLLERVRLPRPAAEDLDELLTWAQSLDEGDGDDMAALARVLPWISARSIRTLYAADASGFRRIFERFSLHVESSGFDFTYCDVLADFSRRAVEKSEDVSILRAAVRSLAVLGDRHNRWYVRDVLTALLQGVRTAEQAVAASDALRQAGESAVTFSVSDFSLRSLHPVLREGISSYLSELAVG